VRRIVLLADRVAVRGGVTFGDGVTVRDRDAVD
jgi:hypothetical protein